jgi:hypothetical protein
MNSLWSSLHMLLMFVFYMVRCWLSQGARLTYSKECRFCSFWHLWSSRPCSDTKDGRETHWLYVFHILDVLSTSPQISFLHSQWDLNVPFHLTVLPPGAGLYSSKQTSRSSIQFRMCWAAWLKLQNRSQLDGMHLLIAGVHMHHFEQ